MKANTEVSESIGREGEGVRMSGFTINTRHHNSHRKMIIVNDKSSERTFTKQKSQKNLALAFSSQWEKNSKLLRDRRSVFKREQTRAHRTRSLRNNKTNKRIKRCEFDFDRQQNIQTTNIQTIFIRMWEAPRVRFWGDKQTMLMDRMIRQTRVRRKHFQTIIKGISNLTVRVLVSNWEPKWWIQSP